MIPNPKQITIELAKRHLLDFTLHTKANYKTAWHNEKLCAVLDDFADGKIPRLMVFMPPRHGKSELGSRRLPAFLLGRNPDAEVIACSYSSGLAEKMNRDVQRIIDTPEYREVFPETTLNTKNVKTDAKGSFIRNSTEFEIVRKDGGGYRCAGVGGGITGTGGDYIILDDPIKNMEEANSQTIRDKVWDWYTSTLYTRLEGDVEDEGKESQNEASILVILTRWHEDDIAGRLLEKAAADPKADQWEVFEFPAIKEDSTNDHDTREIGEALWPGKYPIKRLEKIKASVGSKVWSSLYQQQPTPGEGAIFLRQWLKSYLRLPETRCDLKLISCDLTFKDTKTADFVVMSVYARYGADIFLIDKVKKRMSFTETLEQFKAIVAKHSDAPIKLVEEKANGAALISMLSKSIPGIVPVIPKESKTARAHAVTPYYESGNVYYPDESICSWVGDHIVEMTSFPFGRNDDSVDAETQAVSRLMIGQADAWTTDENDGYNSTNDNLIDSMEW